MSLSTRETGMHHFTKGRNIFTSEAHYWKRSSQESNISALLCCLADSVLSWRWNGRVGRRWRPAAHRLEDGEEKEAPHGDPSLTSVPRSKRIVFSLAGRWPHTTRWLSSQPPRRLNIGRWLDTTDTFFYAGGLNSLYWHLLEDFCINRELIVTLGDIYFFSAVTHLFQITVGLCWTGRRGYGCGYWIICGIIYSYSMHRKSIGDGLILFVPEWWCVWASRIRTVAQTLFI